MGSASAARPAVHIIRTGRFRMTIVTRLHLLRTSRCAAHEDLPRRCAPGRLAFPGKVAFSQVNRHHARSRRCPDLVVCLDDVPRPAPADAQHMSGPAEDPYDVIVIGAGPIGQTVADRARAAGLSVAVVERELVGGECSYWACIPSKAMLRPVVAVADACRVAGARQAVTGPVDAPAVFTRRDGYVTGWNDEGQAACSRTTGAEPGSTHGGHDDKAGKRTGRSQVGTGRAGRPWPVPVGRRSLRTRRQRIFPERAVVACPGQPSLPPMVRLDHPSAQSAEAVSLRGRGASGRAGCGW